MEKKDVKEDALLRRLAQKCISAWIRLAVLQ